MCAHVCVRGRGREGGGRERDNLLQYNTGNWNKTLFDKILKTKQKDSDSVTPLRVDSTQTF